MTTSARENKAHSTDNENPLQQFFEAYESFANRGIAGEDVAKEVAAVFANYFVESSPAGVMGGKNDEEFLRRIPEGYASYKKMGITSMKIKSVSITPLNELHYQARVHWQSFYKRKDGKEGVIDFELYYFLAKQENAYRIFAYISGDEQGVMKEHGLIE